jgi:dienelactone hydrolase
MSWALGTRRHAYLIAMGAMLGVVGLFTKLGIKEHLRALAFANQALPHPSGAYAVGMVPAQLRASSAHDAGPELTIRLWYPATVPGDEKPRRDWLSAPTRAPAFENAALAQDPAVFPVILLAPSWFGMRDENSLRAAELASHGYVVVAFDDVVHDPEGLTGAEGSDRQAGLDFSSAETYARTRPLADARVAREARKSTLVLDRLATDPRWGKRLALERVGFLGFSFGGAAAAEAASSDARIAAAVNLDGWVFGDAARSGVRGPYLVLWSEFPVPYTSPIAPKAEVDLMNAYIAFERRHLQSPDKFGFKIDGLDHLDYCDRLTFPAFNNLWQPKQLDRARTRRIIDAYVLDFFDAYLRARAPKLLTAASPPYPEVHLIGSLGGSSSVQRTP